MYKVMETSSKYDGEKYISIQIKVVESNQNFLHTGDKFIFVLDGEANICINKNEYTIKKMI